MDVDALSAGSHTSCRAACPWLMAMFMSMLSNICISVFTSELQSQQAKSCQQRSQTDNIWEYARMGDAADLADYDSKCRCDVKPFTGGMHVCRAYCSPRTLHAL